MAPTVALLGASGQLGSNILAGLVTQHDKGSLKLVVLHRASSDTSRIPASVEKRVLDSDNATAAEVAGALRGVDILVSAGKSTADGGKRFLESLAALPKGQLKAFVPSWFTTNWTPEEEEDAQVAYRHSKIQLLKYAKSLGLPITTISSTLFDNYFFLYSYNGIDAANNRLLIYAPDGDLDKSLASTFSFVRLPYLGAAVGQIVTRPWFTGYQHYTVVETEFTGRELADALSKQHGTPPAITPFTDADFAKVVDKGDAAATLGYAWIKHWGAGNWSTTGRFEAGEGVRKATLEELVAAYAKSSKL